MSVQAFVSASFGGALGAAVLERALSVVMKKNTMLLGSELDAVHPQASHIPLGQLSGILQQQALMVSMKELYGWLTLISLFCLMLFWISHNSVRPLHALHPRYRVIRRYIKHELRAVKR